VPFGEHQGAVLGDGDRVLHVGAAGAVGAAEGPAVGVGVDLVGGVQEPRLDGDHQAGPELEAAAGAGVVGHVRVAVHGAAHAVAAELQVDAEPGGPGGVADGRGDVEEPVADVRLGDARLEGAGGDVDEVEVLLAGGADHEADGRVGHPAVHAAREVEGD